MTVPFFPHNLLRINDNLEVKENKLGPFTYYSIVNFFKEITHINNMLKYSYAPATMMPAWKNKTALSRNFKDYFDCRINLNLDQHGFEEENSTVNFLKNTFDITNLELVEDNFLQFSFGDEIYNVQVDDVSIKEIQEIFTTFNFYEEE